jgi:hypothetical protein
MGSILVLYYAARAPLRRTIADHLNSIRRYSGRPCIYVNLAVGPVPSWVQRLDIGLVVFHTTLLATRWFPESLRRIARRLGAIQGLACRRIAIPQDEFLNTDLLVDFLREFRVDHVFTCAPPDEWQTIYGPLMSGGVGLTRVLTGYLEPRAVRRIRQLATTTRERDIDIGYRSWKPEPWLGRHGMLKGWIAERFAEEGRRLGLRVDISMDPADTLMGDAWDRFLLRSRFTIGVEGGASILDRDGRIRTCVNAYSAEHPDASFEEIEQSCFPGLDGTFNLRAISPRHLEACATRTPQILIEGSYNGILEPRTHYIPLRPDFANISEALEEIVSGDGATQMAERAYRDVVASGNYTYESFVATLLASVPADTRQVRAGRSIPIRAISAWGAAADRVSWVRVWVRPRLKGIAKETLRRAGLLESARRTRRRLRARSGREV